MPWFRADGELGDEFATTEKSGGAAAFSSRRNGEALTEQFAPESRVPGGLPANRL